MGKKRYLFSYGTLKQKEIQRILLGTEVKMRAAVLYDWRLYEDVDQYYFIKPDPGHDVRGYILELTPEQFWVIDQWEEIPCYSRMKVSVSCDGKQIEDVFIYVRPESVGKPVFNPGLSGHSMETDLATARLFRENLDDIKRLSFADMYLLIPCTINQKREREIANDHFSETFIGRFSCQATLKRSSLGMIDVIVRTKRGELNTQTQTCPAFLTLHAGSFFAVVTIAMPATILSPFDLDDLRISQNKQKPYLLLKEWLKANGLTKKGKKRIAIFSQTEMKECDIFRLTKGLRSHDLIREWENTKVYSQIFFSDFLFLAIASEFQDDYQERISLQIPILSYIEDMLLKKKIAEYP